MDPDQGTSVSLVGRFSPAPYHLGFTSVKIFHRVRFIS